MAFEFKFVIDYNMKIFWFAFDSNSKVGDSYKILVMGFGIKYCGDNIWFLYWLHVVFEL